MPAVRKPMKALRAHDEKDGCRCARAQQHADLAADIGPAGDKASAVFGCHFNEVGDRSGELSADRQALNQAQHHQEHACPNADLRIGRHDTQQGRRHDHRHNRGDQHHLPADEVANGTENDRPQGAHEKPGGKGAESGDQGDGFDLGREEQLRDHHRHIAIEREVVPFYDVADRTGGDDPERLVRFLI